MLSSRFCDDDAADVALVDCAVHDSRDSAVSTPAFVM